MRWNKDNKVLSKRRIRDLQGQLTSLGHAPADMSLLCAMAEEHRKSVKAKKKARRRQVKRYLKPTDRLSLKQFTGSFECRRCGRCCLKFGEELPATEQDIDRWVDAGRDDILAYVQTMSFGDDTIYELWFSPQTGRQVLRCPWLRKMRGKDRYERRIYDVRPDVCRQYPVSKRQAAEDGCPGIQSAM